jgi:hypothetical protein
MRQRARKFVGAVVIISYVIVYALVAMALAQARLVQEAHGLVQGLVYVVLGMIWILPLMPMIAWMERPD